MTRETNAVFQVNNGARSRATITLTRTTAVRISPRINPMRRYFRCGLASVDVPFQRTVRTGAALDGVTATDLCTVKNERMGVGQISSWPEFTHSEGIATIGLQIKRLMPISQGRRFIYLSQVLSPHLSLGSIHALSSGSLVGGNVPSAPPISIAGAALVGASRALGHGGRSVQLWHCEAGNRSGGACQSSD